MGNVVSQDEITLRDRIRRNYLADESQSVVRLLKACRLDKAARRRIEKSATRLVNSMRSDSQPGLMEKFLAEYGLSSKEGVALMCLAEALLRVPDELTMDALIQDKIVAPDWGRHIGNSGSTLVNASTWALMLTGKIISAENAQHWELAATLRSMIKRFGEPVIRSAAKQAMRVLGHQFVLGQDIQQAQQRAIENEIKGYTYSYDMLGESAHTAADAEHYFQAYSNSIKALASQCQHQDCRLNPGISVKLSALHPRYEFTQHQRLLGEIVARVGSLSLLAKKANMSLTVDAEEADKLELSLDIIERVLDNPDLQGWNGFGIAVQAYMPRAIAVIDWLYHLAARSDRRIMVRLVKGAYWDSEIKKAQQQGLLAYPVFTRKLSTDVSYLACVRRLFDYSDRLYPQFATHNAHTVSAVLDMAGGYKDYEFQHLHGMGESLYETLKQECKQPCRIYAPVGVHRDLLAYLVRRLLENGANSSFVNQLVDKSVAIAELVRDPVSTAEQLTELANPVIPLPAEIFTNGRRNSKGWNLPDPLVLQPLQQQLSQFQHHQWSATPIVNGQKLAGKPVAIMNPADNRDKVGEVIYATGEEIDLAINCSLQAQLNWQGSGIKRRVECLLKLAGLLEQHTAEFSAIMAREAGKNLTDSIAEVREAVDFCRYYAQQADSLSKKQKLHARGIFVCISPWNFPLAIFTGQIVAALVCGNAVIAKPAEQTPFIAARTAELMFEAGIPAGVLQLLPGEGAAVGGRLCADSRIHGVCFTGSVQTARLINQAMAARGNPQAVLIAETGGLNSMIVDSSALPEQAVADIVRSAFQSSGQRCSALRVLFLQEDIAERVIEMIKGVMDELCIADPREIKSDLGPVIDAEAKLQIKNHCDNLQQQGLLLHRIKLPCGLEKSGHYIGPSLFELKSIDQLQQEVFGPVLHVIRFATEQLDSLADNINETGYGLTLGIHSRIETRVKKICGQARVGNIYVNRDQIGAVVGVQPFGGEGLSGTGPKAGGLYYLLRFLGAETAETPQSNKTDTAFSGNTFLTHSSTGLQSLVTTSAGVQQQWNSEKSRHSIIQQALKNTSVEIAGLFNEVLKNLPGDLHQGIDLPGPTGERNHVTLHARGVIICLGKSEDDLQVILQCALSLYLGNGVIAVKNANNAATMQSLLTHLIEAGAPAGLLAIVRHISLAELTSVSDLSAVFSENSVALQRAIRKALSLRNSAIIPLVTHLQDWTPLILERCLCIDTTASGGNAELLALSG